MTEYSEDIYFTDEWKKIIIRLLYKVHEGKSWETFLRMSVKDEEYWKELLKDLPPPYDQAPLKDILYYLNNGRDTGANGRFATQYHRIEVVSKYAPMIVEGPEAMLALEDFDEFWQIVYVLRNDCKKRLFEKLYKQQDEFIREYEEGIARLRKRLRKLGKVKKSLSDCLEKMEE